MTVWAGWIRAEPSRAEREPVPHHSRRPVAPPSGLESGQTPRPIDSTLLARSLLLLLLATLLPVVAIAEIDIERASERRETRGGGAAMGFISFVGRVLFASLFLLSAYQEFLEFGSDGGPAAKTLKPKFNLFVKQVSKNTGFAVPHIDIKTVVAATMFLKGFGGLLFIFSSSFGAFLLLIYLAFITPVVYDFYNYEMETTQFAQLFAKFLQNVALFGALLFFLGMKNSIPRRRSKGRTTKTKTN